MSNFKKMAYGSFLISLASFSQGVYSGDIISVGNPVFQLSSAIPTRLQVPVIPEGTEIYNNIVIKSGCSNGGNYVVMGQSVVFPDGADSTVTIDGAVSKQRLSEFLGDWPAALHKIQSHDAFAIGGVRGVYGMAGTPESLGPIAGFWGGVGAINGSNRGLIPFSTDPLSIQPTSCAKSVKLVMAIADVCTITSITGFNLGTVNLWTPAVGSDYDGAANLSSYNSPATLTVSRNLATNPLPAACGAGAEVVVTPSAAQLNRDMPVFYEGKQAWPLP